MQKLRKYCTDLKDKNLASKLSSYKSLAAAALICPVSMTSQSCADLNNLILVDINGDGKDDTGIVFAPITKTFINSYTSFLTGVSFSFMSTNTFVLSTSSIGYPYYLCSIINFPNIGQVAIYPNTGASIFLSWQEQQVGNFFNGTGVAYIYYVYENNYVVAYGNSGANVIGLSLGAQFCEGVATQFSTYLDYLACYILEYNFPSLYGSRCISNNVNILSGDPLIVSKSCSTYTANYSTLLTYFMSGTFPLEVNNVTCTSYLPTSNFVDFKNCTPGNSNFIAVQFTDATSGETHLGWVEIGYTEDGLVCNGTGYQQCSVEDAVAAGEPSLACINVGQATFSSNGCIPCEITDVEVTAVCCDGGTPEDDSDDVFEVTLHATGTGVSATYGVTGGTVQSGLSYNMDEMITGVFPVSGGPVTFIITDADDPTCTYEVEVQPPGICSGCDADAGLMPSISPQLDSKPTLHKLRKGIKN